MSSSRPTAHINPVVHPMAETAATMHSNFLKAGGTSTSFLIYPQVETTCLYIIVSGGRYFETAQFFFNHSVYKQMLDAVSVVYECQNNSEEKSIRSDGI